MNVDSEADVRSRNGPPVVVVPGLQGRWEWAQAGAARAGADVPGDFLLALSGDIGSGRALDPELGFENYSRQLDDVLDAPGVERAVMCGVSFGGFVALRYAARYPERVVGAGAGVRARAGLAAERAAGGLALAAVVVGARLRGQLAAARLARGQRRAAAVGARLTLPRAAGPALRSPRR